MCLVINSVIDEILEEMSKQIAAAGLDPLPVPDIKLPFSMDKVNFKMTLDVGIFFLHS